jgi:hypothetical protein
MPMKRQREIIVPQSTAPQDARPIRAETRAKLVASIARGRRWLDEIVTGAVTSIEQIAARDKCSVRQVNMTISLAFLAPELVKAAVEGRLPRGIGISRQLDVGVLQRFLNTLNMLGRFACQLRSRPLHSLTREKAPNKMCQLNLCRPLAT